MILSQVHCKNWIPLARSSYTRMSYILLRSGMSWKEIDWRHICNIFPAELSPQLDAVIRNLIFMLHMSKPYTRRLVWKQEWNLLQSVPKASCYFRIPRVLYWSNVFLLKKNKKQKTNKKKHTKGVMVHEVSLVNFLKEISALHHMPVSGAACLQRLRNEGATRAGLNSLNLLIKRISKLLVSGVLIKVMRNVASTGADVFHCWRH